MIQYSMIKCSTLKVNARDLCTAPRIISLSPLSLATDVTDATLGASGLWLGTRTEAGDTATLTKSFILLLIFVAAHGSKDSRTLVRGRTDISMVFVIEDNVLYLG